MLGLGLWGLVVRFVLIRSSDAYVTMPLIAVRAEIDGTFTPGDAGVGDLVDAGERLGEVVKPRNESVDDIHLATLDARLAASAAELEGLSELGSRLADLDADLRRGGARYVSRRVDLMSAQLSAMDAQVAAARASEQAAAAKLKRGELLASEGLLSTQSLEDLARDATLTEKASAVADIDARALRSSVTSLKGGVNPDPGGADRPYSQQRLDELALRTAGVEADRRKASLEYATTRDQLDSERQRLRANRVRSVVAPARARVWRAFATQEAYVERDKSLSSSSIAAARASSCGSPSATSIA